MARVVRSLLLLLLSWLKATLFRAVDLGKQYISRDCPCWRTAGWSRSWPCKSLLRWARLTCPVNTVDFSSAMPLYVITTASTQPYPGLSLSLNAGKWTVLLESKWLQEKPQYCVIWQACWTTRWIGGEHLTISDELPLTDHRLHGAAGFVTAMAVGYQTMYYWSSLSKSVLIKKHYKPIKH